MTGAQIAAMIDHTLLRFDALEAEIDQLCSEALEFDFAFVCVNSSMVPRAVSRLAGSKTGVCSVVGFPLGAVATEAKAFEAGWVTSAGASEVDMVINVGWLKGGLDSSVVADIESVVRASGGADVKVIIEASLLTDDEKRRASKLSQEAGAAFVKTSTGFGGSVALAEDVRLISTLVAPRLGVKASGGIRSLGDLFAMVSAGATRIGTSSGVSIIQEALATGAPATED